MLAVLDSDTGDIDITSQSEAVASEVFIVGIKSNNNNLIMEKPVVVENLHQLPIVIFISLPTTFIITYVIAVWLGHVQAGFPYISDAATYAPESCIFAQLINMTSALMAFVIYIRHSQIKEYIVMHKLHSAIQKWNNWALILGLLAVLGLTIVANFQETSVLLVHFVGAFMCFGCGTAYFWTQAVCSYYLHPLGCSLKIARLRLTLAVFNTLCFFIILITGILARMEFHGSNPRKWSQDDGGWELHVVSTISEWVCAINFCVYILTFSGEFREICMVQPKVFYNGEKIDTIRRVQNNNEDVRSSKSTLTA